MQIQHKPHLGYSRVPLLNFRGRECHWWCGYVVRTGSEITQIEFPIGTGVTQKEAYEQWLKLQPMI